MDTGIEVSLWNVLKYILLAYLLAPVAEGAMRFVNASRNAYLVKQGKPIRLESSIMGNISLHQEVETLHYSSRLLQIFSILLALTVALPFEFSSGAQTTNTWSRGQSSRSSTTAMNTSNDVILLALQNPSVPMECVLPDQLADIGEYISMEPIERNPPFLDGLVSIDDINQILAVRYRGQLWKWLTIHSRRGDVGMLFYAGGESGQQVIIGNPERRGLMVADFETGSLCVGLIGDKFLCFDMKGQFTVSQLASSIGAVDGASLFFRAHSENAARLFRFKEGLVSVSIGDPSNEDNLYEQKSNESAFDWLQRLINEDGRSYSISTLKLDEQLRPADCQSPASVQIRPLQLRVGDSLPGERFRVTVSRDSHTQLVKVGPLLLTKVLTTARDGWKCAVDMSYGVCLNEEKGTLYFLSKDDYIYAYTTEFELQVTQNVESHADLAVMLSIITFDIRGNGFAASWDVRNLLPLSNTPIEGARSITRETGTSVLVSSGTRTTGTIEIWAIVLFGSFFVFFTVVVLFFKFRKIDIIDIERTYRVVVRQKDGDVSSEENSNSAPTISFETPPEDEAASLTASYNTHTTIRKSMDY